VSGERRRSTTGKQEQYEIASAKPRALTMRWNSHRGYFLMVLENPLGGRVMNERKNSARKRNALRRRAEKRNVALPLLPARVEEGNASLIKMRESALPPLPVEPEKDMRAANEKRRTLARILGEGGGFHGALPRRNIGLG